ncbi:MAG TPA: glutathione S-transferase family protein [Gaiellaceae bacterium]|nr:glutathione S-transferase family protein [Gaiellaceae bacterium]
MITLYDAARCPYCARVRIVLAEKGVEHEVVAIDLSDRPAWLYEKNPSGKVPVIEEDSFVLPESPVIMEYLDERYPQPALLPADPAARALARLQVERFDDRLGDDYYAYRRGEPNRLEQRLAELDLGHQAFVDIAYLPWIVRAREMLGLELPAHLAAWLERAAARPAVAVELETVAALAA